jgi:quinoprotein glucose dehydrogenase
MHNFGVSLFLLIPAGLALVQSALAQTGTASGEWRYYGGDAQSTKYSPLDQINRDNVAKLQVAWTWKAQNFGPRADPNYEVTPLMVHGVLYLTAGTRRDTIAVDAATGETLWMYRPFAHTACSAGTSAGRRPAWPGHPGRGWL